MENDYPGFEKFFECFSTFKNKLHIDYLSESALEKSNSIFDGDDSDSDSDDSDDIEDMFKSFLEL